MSGLYLLALIAIWLLVGWIIYRAWQRWKPTDRIAKIGHIVIGVLLFSVWFGGAFWEVVGKKEFYDAQVRELCAKDGGVKVYETVVLPAEKFDKYGNVGISNKKNAKQSDEYYFESVDSYLRNNDPIIIRSTTRIIRRNDGKILGESVRYGRGGGDLPGPWHPSSYDCPQIKDAEGKLETSIFTKGVE